MVSLAQNSTEAPARNTNLVTLPGAEVCEIGPWAVRICFEIRYVEVDRRPLWTNRWFPKKCCIFDESGPICVEKWLLDQAMDDIKRLTGDNHEPVLEDRGQSPRDYR